MDSDLRTRVLLSIQRALLGEIFPALRAITVEWDTRIVSIHAFVDGSLAETDAESLSCISTEVTADFAPDMEVECVLHRVDAPQPIHDARAWVYRRRESE